jgi:hypothetical protein
VIVVVLINGGILTSSCTACRVGVKRSSWELGNRIIEVSRRSCACFVLENIFQKVDGLIEVSGRRRYQLLGKLFWDIVTIEA